MATILYRITERIAEARARSDERLVLAFVLDELERAVDGIDQMSTKIAAEATAGDSFTIARMNGHNEASRVVRERIRALQDEMRGLGA